MSVFPSLRLRVAIITLSALTLSAFTLSVAGAAAQSPEPAPLDAVAEADLARVETYMNALTTLDSKFVQLSTDGFVEGRIRIDRPGKMRIDYAPPVPVRIVASNLVVMYYDHELHQTTYIPTFETPAYFLLRDEIDLDDGLTVTRFEREASVIRITMVETDNPDSGQISIVFEDKPLRLAKWRVVDTQANVIDVALIDPRFGVEFENAGELFSTADPELGSSDQSVQ